MNLRCTRLIVAVACLIASGFAAAQPRVDLAGRSVLRLDENCTSADVAIHGVTAGMSWDEARGILDAAQLPYLISKGVKRTIYIPPVDPTMQMDVDPDGRIGEIRLSPDAPVSPGNRYLMSPNRWKLTTARVEFFGSEGDERCGRCRCCYIWPRRGFALRYACGGSFAFVLMRTGPRGVASVPRDTVYLKDTVAAPRFPVLQESFGCFISGWYLPSTERGVNVFRDRSAKGGFREAPYIMDDDTLCTAGAKAMSGRMESFVKSVLDAAALMTDSNSKMYFYVSGFADERELRPGKYVDESVSFGPMSISKGARLAGASGNVDLSWLRAYYAREELLTTLRATAKFSALEKYGRVVWELHGLGVDHGKKPLRDKRRVDVRMHVQ